jgi:hypothetical protein
MFTAAAAQRRGNQGCRGQEVNENAEDHEVQDHYENLGGMAQRTLVRDRISHGISLPRIRTISAFTVAPSGRSLDRRELAREVQSISAEKQAAEALQRCPECGADQFTQHAARGEPPG